MKTRTLIAFLLAACFFASCGKTETFNSNPPPPPRNTFTISGSIHDLTIDTSGYAILPLTIAAATGDAHQDVFTIVWLSGPAPVRAEAMPRGGTTDFTTSVTFGYRGVYDDTGAPGTYPMKVTAVSASDTETYDFNLTVLPYNGFRI